MFRHYYIEKLIWSLSVHEIGVSSEGYNYRFVQNQSIYSPGYKIGFVSDDNMSDGRGKYNRCREFYQPSVRRMWPDNDSRRNY